MKDLFKFCPRCGGGLSLFREGEMPRMRCPSCGFIEYHNPAPAAGILVLDGEERILLVKRRFEPYKGGWTIPSGYVEYDEDVRETAVRELKEETGVDVEIDALHAVESAFDDPRGNTLLVVFRGHIADGSVRAGDDAEEARFFPLDRLPEIAFECQRRIIGRLRENRLP